MHARQTNTGTEQTDTIQKGSWTYRQHPRPRKQRKHYLRHLDMKKSLPIGLTYRKGQYRIRIPKNWVKKEDIEFRKSFMASEKEEALKEYQRIKKAHVIGKCKPRGRQRSKKNVQQSSRHSLNSTCERPSEVSGAKRMSPEETPTRTTESKIESTKDPDGSESKNQDDYFVFDVDKLFETPPSPLPNSGEILSSKVDLSSNFVDKDFSDSPRLF